MALTPRVVVAVFELPQHAKPFFPAAPISTKARQQRGGAPRDQERRAKRESSLSSGSMLSRHGKEKKASRYDLTQACVCVCVTGSSTRHGGVCAAVGVAGNCTIPGNRMRIGVYTSLTSCSATKPSVPGILVLSFQVERKRTFV